MKRREFLTTVAKIGIVGSPLLGSSGCGSLLHSERVGQPHSRDLDWNVVALDGLGLILFFVPGIVAFAVDFMTGAIYLPSEQVANTPNATDDDSHLTNTSLQQKQIRPNELTLPVIEEVVSTHVGQDINLQEPSVRFSKLESIDNYSDAKKRHLSNPEFGRSTTAIVG